MGLLLKLHLSSCVTKNTQDFSITANVTFIAISVMGDERCHINLFNDYTVSIYVNGKCKHQSTSDFFLHFRYTSQFCRLTDFLVQVH